MILEAHKKPFLPNLYPNSMYCVGNRLGTG